MSLLLLPSPPSTPPPAPTGEWTFEVWSPLGVQKAVLDPADGSRVFEPKFRDPYRGIGAGSFFLQNDDPDYNNIAEGDIVRCYKGTTAVFGWIVQHKVRHSVAKAAAAGVPSGEKYTEFSGPGMKALGARSPIRPYNKGRFQPKETIRPFDWTSPLFDFSGWSAAEAIKRVDEPTAHWDGTPQFVPDPTICWIGETGANDDDAAAGVRLMRAPSFTITEDDTIVTIFGWIDNEGFYYLNGVQIMAIDTFHDCRYVDLKLPVGEYRLSGFGRNLEPTALSAGNNPFAFGFGVYTRTSDGAFIDRLLVSDASSKILALPTSTPGLPLGEAVRQITEEGQARTELQGLGLGFTDTIATNGATFPAATDVGVVVGESWTDYLLALEDALVDVWISPEGQVQLFYPRGSRGTATGVTFTDGVSLKKLDHEIRDDRVDNLFVDYAGGYVEVGSGNYSKSLPLSQVDSEDAAVRIATEVLAGRDTTSVRFAADIHTGTGREPYDDFKPGDTVNVDDVDGTPTAVLVQALTMTVDAAGRAVWACEFGDPLDPLATIAERAVRKLAATRSATNVQNALPTVKASGGQVYQQTLLEFSYEPAALQISQKSAASATRDIGYLSVMLDTTDTEDHIFTLKLNGVPLAAINVTIPVGTTEGRVWADIGAYRAIAGDKITLEFTGGPVRWTAKLAFR